VTTISNSTTIGITLSSPTYLNPIVIAPGITISNAGNAVYASSGSWTIQNDGTVSSVDSAGIDLLSRRRSPVRPSASTSKAVPERW